VFVHVTSLQKSGCGIIIKGDTVTYDIITNRNASREHSHYRRGQVSLQRSASPLMPAGPISS
jgi:hypothetical protein